MEHEMREQVKKRYGEIAAKVGKQPEKASCCCQSSSAASSCCDATANALGYSAADLSGLPEQAVDASLGCANPLLFAKLKEGETVLDLGSGGGIDVLAASKYVGVSGKAFGLDMTDEMLALANRNKAVMGVTNVEFIKGYIEDIPLADGSIDVIMSNCVINLTEDKGKALAEAYRVLKDGGRLAIADMVSLKPLKPELKKQTELWCGCLAGTLLIEEYRAVLEKVGFKNVEIEPVFLYTRDMIIDLYGKHLSELEDADLDEADGAYAGAQIKAVK